ESLTVGYTVQERVPEGDEEKKAWFNEIGINLLLEKAFEETENATEGDSLRFCYRYVHSPIKYGSYPDHTDILFTFNFTYFTTAEQEEKLTEAVDALLEEFAFTAQTTERKKIDAIYQWLCKNVTYDYAHTNDYNLKFSAYAAMINKTAVCEGYAALFYRLAEEAGLDARIITGKATHNGENHGWNIVRQRDWYYYLDATWDAGKEPRNYEYYLRGKTDFEGHINGAQYETEAFRTRYPIADVRSSECDWKRMTNEEYHWYQCTVCGAAEKEVKHSGGIATCKERATCVDCGAAYGGLAEHTYDNACDSICNICTAPRLVSHQYAAATCTSPKTCIDCGATEGRKSAHVYTNDCDIDCNVCKATRIISHRFGGYVYNNDATFQKDGTQTRSCSVCQKIETVTAAGTQLPNPFKDIKANKYYTDPVLWAVEKGITNGTAKDTFSPTNECTRGQIVTFLWRAADSPEPKSTANPFADVSADKYYYKAVLWAVEKGITTGTSANTFSPDAACTRGQVVTFMWRAKNKPAANAANGFKDVQKGAYYYDAVLWAVKNGITNGMGEGIFAPDATCTRGQIVTFLYRAYA
ncbi:MAG: S-layer homology domain-containing protein, partial [Clostridia bacterium]|nr:S-layer homology domain-containing protein [Clostridia bacterium]